MYQAHRPSRPADSGSPRRKTFHRFGALIKRARRTLAATFLAGVAGISIAHAFPDRAVTIIVPFAAGGTTDLAARTLAVTLSEKWGQPVVVENKPGAGSIVGLTEAANAAPDGYTLVIGPDPALSVNPLIYENLPYNVEEDFDPITVIIRLAMAILVTDETPASTLEEFIELTNKQPVTYGSFGPGSAPHLIFEVLRRKTDADNLIHVPYGGVGPVLQALQSGEVNASVMSLGTALRFIEAGDARGLAVDSDERLPYAADVPTFTELNLDIHAPAYWALLAPKGTPPEIIAQLHDDFVEAMDDPTWQEYMERYRFMPGMDSPEDTAKLISDTTELWRPVVEELGIKLD